MVWKASIVDVIFSAVGVFLNGLGLFILMKVRNSRMDVTQWHIITNLCVFDFCSCVILTVTETLFILRIEYSSVAEIFANIFMTGFYGTTFWLVFDRYLHMKLNIKYVIFWSKNKTRLVTILLWSFSILSGCLLWFFSEFTFYAILVTLDTVIVLFSAFVYGRAIKLSRKVTKITHRTQLRKPAFKGMLLSATILSAYAILVAIPDIIIISTFHKYESWSLSAYTYFNVSYVVAMWIDALVYIFLCPQNRSLLKKAFGKLQTNYRDGTRKPISVSTFTQSILTINLDSNR